MDANILKFAWKTKFSDVFRANIIYLEQKAAFQRRSEAQRGRDVFSSGLAVKVVMAVGPIPASKVF